MLPHISTAPPDAFVNPALAREQALLLACCRTDTGHEQQARIRTLVLGLENWGEFLALATRERLIPLVAHSLHAACRETIPEAQATVLLRASRAIAAKNLAITQHLLELLRDFDAERIPYRVFKGPVLATSVYGNLALRTFEDADLLVPEENVAQAWSILIAEGYAPLVDVDPRRCPQLLRYDCQCQFINRENRSLHIDLHWHLAQASFNFHPTREQAWESEQIVTIGGRGVPTFGPEFSMIFLALHAARHLWEGLSWVVDVAALMRNTQLDWSRLLAQASALHVSRMVLISATLAHDLLQVPLPEVVRIESEKDEQFGYWRSRILSLTLHEAGRDSEIENHTMMLQFREHWQDKLRYAWGAVAYPTVAEWGVWKLPRSLSGLYYLLRLSRLMDKYLKRMYSRPSI